MSNLVTVLRDAERRLAQSSPSARLDAEVLLAHVLHKPRSYLTAWPAKKLPADALTYFADLVDRPLRARRACPPLSDGPARRNGVNPSAPCVVHVAAGPP